MNCIIFIIGVSGSGKSTIGKLIAKEFTIPFFDGDDFHPKSNIKKMSEGKALNDYDREFWLKSLNNLAKKQVKKNGCVIACSALKQKYRDVLGDTIQNNIKWIHLTGSYKQIYDRINNRKDHFMPSELLKSQFDILEEQENALQINSSSTPEEIVDIIKNKLNSKSEFGLFGLGVMGKSLCRNLSQKGFKISMYNRHVNNTEVHVAKKFKEEYSELSKALAFDDLSAFINSLEKPRKIMLMVNAGNTIDYVIKDLLPLLSKNDIIIDGGNSNYKKTAERFKLLNSKGIHFIGAGVSGGEKGALTGPSIMPSGNFDAYKEVQKYLESIAAKNLSNNPCCIYVGKEGSGHFVKMIHNGIEYVEMQLLAEVFTILEYLGKNPDEIAAILESWRSKLDSYLLDITIKIIRKKEKNTWLIHKILDKAGNKGTGNWATIASAELGTPNTMIASALFSRYISFYKEERLLLTKKFKKENSKELHISTNDVLESYQFARIINHYQGFKLISEASNKYSWDLNLSEIARIWTEGCIIKSDLMQDLVEVLKTNKNILLNANISSIINHNKSAIKKVVATCVLNDISIPSLSEAIQFLNGISTEYSSANIIQAQRDYFGAHTYQRIDDNTQKYYHTNW